MIMPAPFYPGSPINPSDKKKLTREEFISALTQLGKERYHSLHPFHKLLHSGKLSFEQVPAQKTIFQNEEVYEKGVGYDISLYQVGLKLK